MKRSAITNHKLPITLNDLPCGFSYASAACGIRQRGRPDVALLVSAHPAAAAAVFTKNLVQAAPVIVSREHVRRAARRMRAIIVNSGNANCCTGHAGLRAARDTARQVSRTLGCREEEVVVCSTGVIGVPLRVEKILHVAPKLAATRKSSAPAFSGVARAIMTTDTRPKWAAARCTIGGRTVRLVGCAKGAGMIHPNMATMLAFVLTDAAIEPALLQEMLRAAADRTFNCISVDGDTSTNDTLVVLANGASGVTVRRGPRTANGEAWPARDSSLATRRFYSALESVCKSLAMQIVADGEGAQRVVEITVRGARGDTEAKRVAETIATSPLVKTAFAGADPNWGRILAAAGRSGVRFDPARASIWLAGIPVFRHGVPLDFDERRAHRAMLAKHYRVVLDLGCGVARLFRGGGLKTKAPRLKTRATGLARVWTCDFTGDYVAVNASYRT
jgi:glutamate N-acetyltransferase/amino-acid N-acetyltransferase